jgi:Glycosyl hydrolases family 32 N-terminal domain
MRQTEDQHEHRRTGILLVVNERHRQAHRRLWWTLSLLTVVLTATSIYAQFRAALAVAQTSSGAPRSGSDDVTTKLYHEDYRPQFHFTPAKNWMNDPNGPIYYAGEYHLFYQYNPFGIQWGHMSWGHAISRDLMHWKPLPLALAEENNVMIFSGSTVVDRNNTSGFCRVADTKSPSCHRPLFG